MLANSFSLCFLSLYLVPSDYVHVTITGIVFRYERGLLEEILRAPTDKTTQEPRKILSTAIYTE